MHNKCSGDAGLIWRGETMDKMLLIIWGIFLSVRQWLQPSLHPLESQERRYTWLWSHTSLTIEKTSTSSNWSVWKQPGWESCATSLRYCEVISHKKKNKYWVTRFHCEYDVYWWAEFMSSLQDMWIGQSSSVKMTGKIGVVWEKSGTSFTTVEWITLKHSDGRCEGANHWQQLTLYCIHCCK